MIFEETLKLMENISKDSLDKSVADCHIEGLYNTPKQYQVNDVYQLVLSKLRKVVGEQDV